MPLIQRAAQVGYPAPKMYALVNDIEAYPSFLKGCRVAQVLKREEEHVEARLLLEKGPLLYDLTTRNRHIQDSSIEMNLLKGPFKSLRGLWQFVPLAPEVSRIDFELACKGLIPFMDFTLRSFWQELATSLVYSFCDRAQVVYGEQKIELL